MDYKNGIAIITDGLTHKQALRVLETKAKKGLIHPYAVCGYRDAVTGYYDKWYRYFTKSEDEYLHGAQTAINNGAVIEHFIEVKWMA